MMPAEQWALRLLHTFDPETAHGLALGALRLGLAGGTGAVTSDRLKITVAGLALPNPVGAAAGFDKNAEAVDATLRTGFGFCEVGAVTPRPQYGNLRPRLFRLSPDRAAINRFGFNNDGASSVHRNLTRQQRSGIVGVNLGANKATEDKAADYVLGLRRFAGVVDFATINISSPNTERLRDLQGRAALEQLLARVLAARDEIDGPPVFLKVAPDLTDAEIADIAEVAVAAGIDALIATNTTLTRDGVRSRWAQERGGLSGGPLKERALGVLRSFHRHLGGRVPLIGVGGIESAEDAYIRIRAGASAVQLYTAMIYEGVSLGGRIARDLDALLIKDGYSSVQAAVGVDAA